MNDLRYALRTFARSPGLVAAAIVCLALGIGANATIFGVVDTLLFRPPAHVKDPGQVVRLYFRTHSPTFGTFTSSVRSYSLYKLIRDSAHAFSEVAALAGTRATSPRRDGGTGKARGNGRLPRRRGPGARLASRSRRHRFARAGSTGTGSRDVARRQGVDLARCRFRHRAPHRLRQRCEPVARPGDATTA